MSLNQINIIGNLGKDPELRYTPSGDAVCNFSVAVTEKYKNKQGEPQEETEWFNVVVWRNLAEICGKYLTKGKPVYIGGKIKTRSYDDRDGNKRYMTELVASNMEMLGSKGDSGMSPNAVANQLGGTVEKCTQQLGCMCPACNIPF